jgi:hypothetical protein
MATLTFTANLLRHIAVAPCEVEARNVREALEQVFVQQSALRGYVLDDQGQLRQHVMIFVDGVRVTDRAQLTDPVGPRSKVYVMQALTGG